MDVDFLRQGIRLSQVLTSLIFLAVTSVSLAETIIVQPSTVISEPKKFTHVTLDMTHGSFIIRNNATLVINNSIINGTLSHGQPLLFDIESGSLGLNHNQVNISAESISPHPDTQSLEYVIQLAMGGVNITQNQFAIDTPFAAGLLITSSSIPTTGLKITENRVQGFHGVFYLINSDNALIANNILYQNSYGNIVLVGNNGKIQKNNIYFAGSNHLGNSMDIINSDTVMITENNLFTPTCHGIYILNSHNLTVDSNHIVGGITYAMNVLTFPETLRADKYLMPFINTIRKFNITQSQNISITHNYMGQNRFGIAADAVDGLNVQNNYFTQRFTDNAARKFWTDNAILLTDVTNLTWQNNFYKEAYTQESAGENSKSQQFVSFPETGGIVLP